jgi:hypothetical protein
VCCTFQTFSLEVVMTEREKLIKELKVVFEEDENCAYCVLLGRVLEYILARDKKRISSGKGVIPSVEDVALYCEERNNGVDPNKWYDFYASKGWMVGKNKMIDWKACVRTWERTSNQENKCNQIQMEAF